MSRPEELPRSASPLKRRAPSATLDDSENATEDVDMISLPPSANTQGTPTSGLSHVDNVESEDAGSLPDDASIAAQADGNDEDIPDLVGLEVDRASVDETHPGSDFGDVSLMNDISAGNNTPEHPSMESELRQNNSSGEDKGLAQHGSSTANTEASVDSDVKTLDTASTAASTEGPVKNSFLLGAATPASGKNKVNRSGRNSPAPSAPGTRGRQAKAGPRLGLTGLSNLGNTCYMNSALQCIRSVEELSKYFVTEQYVEELNFDNPLGHGGNVARAYANLLNSIYKKSPSPGSVTPRNFKETVGRYAPQFSGWAQQDTQEFLGFLLDGLQEDLNRVKKKPYIEKPDSTDDMVGNPEKIRELAEKNWAIHKARDDSVIGDLFTGLYKSTLVCPTCSKISITFEPFTNLTLPLPVQNMWMKKVKYYPLNDRPVSVLVELDKTASIRSLKEFLSSRTGVQAERLIGAEEYKDKFFKIYEDAQQASEDIQKDDTPCFFELEAPATNLPKKRKTYKYSYLSHDELPSSDDPLAEQMAKSMAVPVLHRLNPRLNKQSRVAASRSSENVLPPHFITLNQEEAFDEEKIRRKVLEKIATFTTHPLLSIPSDDKALETSDNDQTLIQVSDADSDGRVIAQSVEGEDDIVDVSMRDTAQTTSTQADASKAPKLLRTFNTRRPQWLDTTVALDDQLQNLFDLSYFSENSAIPSGWSSIGSNPDKLFPRLEVRKARPQSPSDEDMPSPSGSGTGSEESSADETPDLAPTPEASTRMADESSEDEEALPEITDLATNHSQDLRYNSQELPHRSPRPSGLKGGKKKMKGYKTYSKKGQKRFNKQQQQQQHARRSYQQQNHSLSLYEDDDPEVGSKADGGPLVRLGEGIIVDWNPEAWDMIFGRKAESEDNATATRSTFVSSALETLKDSHLEAKVQARRARSSKGISLDDCLAEFEKEEILSEHDQWYCPQCKAHVRAAKKFDLWHTPDILVVHLKRFSSSGHRRDKIDAVVDFPIEGLNISDRVLQKHDGKDEIYDLIAVDDHMGGLGGGHYTAFARNFVNGTWHKFDDSIVSEVRDTSRMITSHAYLLFYRRRSNGPLGGPVLEESCREWARMFNDEGNSNDDEEAPNDSEGTESR